MNEYLPLFPGGLAITRTAESPVLGGQLMMVTASGTVRPTTPSTPAWLGVAAHDAEPGDQVTIHKGSIQRPQEAAQVAAGALVVAGANGTIETAEADPDDPTLVGIALTDAQPWARLEVAFNR